MLGIFFIIPTRLFVSLLDCDDVSKKRLKTKPAPFGCNRTVEQM